MVYLLWIICFYDALVMLLLPSSATMILAADGATSRMVVDITALGIGMWGFYLKGFKPIANRWLIYFVMFMIFSHFHSPNLDYEAGLIPTDMAIYNFKPMFEVLIFLLMFAAISNMNLTSHYRLKIYKSLAWIGAIYSLYIISQRLGLDQIYKMIDMDICHLSRNPECGGFVSQPVYAAMLIAMCLPFAIKYVPKLTILLIVGMIATGNRSALIASAILSLVLIKYGRKYAFWVLFAYGAFLGLAEAIYWVHPDFMTSFHFHEDPTTGRLLVWKQMISDFFHPAFPGIHKTYILTGMGIGSFSVFYPFFNHSGWTQAHNEFIETLYTLSFMGLFLFIKIIGHVFKTVTEDCLFMGLMAILVCSFTMPVFHHPQLQFLTVLLAGLAYNKEVFNGMGCTTAKD